MEDSHKAGQPTPPGNPTPAGDKRPGDRKKIEADNAERLSILKTEFQTLWVAGTTGAYFAALASNLPVAIKEASRSPDFAYTVDRLLRYGYLLWLLVYFFMSNVLNKKRKVPSRQDIAFDIVQSTCALVAAYSLGFTTPEKPLDPGSYIFAFGITNATILVICLLSLALFRHVPPKEINTQRGIGAILSGASIVILFFVKLRMDALLLLSLAYCGLLVMLVVYICKRIKIQPSELDEGTSA
jgi:hypothetical protein